MATITQKEKEFIKGVFKHYSDQYTGQEILGFINKRRDDVSNHINIGRISETKKNSDITPMNKDKVDVWIKSCK